MTLSARQQDLLRIRRINTSHRTGHCAVAACIRPLSELGRFCRVHLKREALTGSAYHTPIDKTLEYRAVQKTLWPLVDGRYRAYKPMLRELRGLLATLPVAPRQGSTRGLKPLALAQAILWHIVKQRDHRSSRRRGITPERRILVAALAAECMPKACSSPQYRKAQVARCIYKLLWRDKRELFGRTIRVRISFQGKWAKQRLFELVEPIYREQLNGIRSLVSERMASGERGKIKRTEP